MVKMTSNPTLNPKRLSEDGITPSRSFSPFLVALIIVVVLLTGLFTLRHFRESNREIYAESTLLAYTNEAIGTFNDANFARLKRYYSNTIRNNYLADEADFKKLRENFWAGKDGIRLISHTTPHINRVSNLAEFTVGVAPIKPVNPSAHEKRSYPVKMSYIDNNWVFITPFLLNDSASERK